MNINEILLQLGIGSKETIYMSVSPSIGALEVIKVDSVSKMITAYASKPLEYNESLREITDYEEFKSAVRELFEELNISTHCNVVLNLPMVLFGSKEVPLILNDDAVNEVLVSEAEQTYTFKRHDPLVAWMDSGSNQNGEMRKIFYSALQKDGIEAIRNALSELGATLVSVRTSLETTINALSFSELTAEQMQENMTWNLVLITLSGYSICSMLGSKIIDYYEEPLALKSFDGEEVYNAVTTSAQLALMNYPANYLYIVSSTDLVSAELLAARLSNVGSVVGFLENNTYRKEEFIPVSLEILPDTASKITLEALGIAVANQPNLPVQMDFMSGFAFDGGADDDSPVKIRIGEKEYEITPEVGVKIAGMIVGILIIPIILLLIILPLAQGKLQTKLDALNTKSSDLQTQVKAYSDEEAQLDSFNVKREIQDTLKNNRAKLLAYSALGEAVPKSLWVTYFFTQADGKIDIKGAATNVEDVYVFFKNLKDSLINTKLRLYRLEMATNDIDDAVENSQQNYIFEITNMSEAELTALANAGQETKGASAAGAKAGKAQASATPPASNGGAAKNSVPPAGPSEMNENSDSPIIKKEGASVPKTLPFGLK